MTGVPRTPIGWISPQPTPGPVADGPMGVIHTTAPVVSSSAYTILLVVAAKRTPLLAGPSSRYSGEPHIAPLKAALKFASIAIVAAFALVSIGCTKLPSREGCLLRSRTEFVTSEAPPLVPPLAPSPLMGTPLAPAVLSVMPLAPLMGMPLSPTLPTAPLAALLPLPGLPAPEFAPFPVSLAPVEAAAELAGDPLAAVSDPWGVFRPTPFEQPRAIRRALTSDGKRVMQGASPARDPSF